MRPLPLLVLLATLAFAASGFAFPFDGYDGAQVPIPQPDPPVQPAGWAFSIWGLIFLWLIGSAAFGVLRRAGDDAWDAVRLPLLGSVALGVAWLPIAQRSAVWATVAIFAMAALAVAAMLRAPARDRWLLRAPVSLYAGWLTAASFVSLGSTLAGWGLLSPVPAAFVCLTLALVSAAAIQADKPEAPLYAVAVAWALLGIAIKNAGEFPGVALLAGLGLLSVFAVLGARRRDRRRRVTP